MATGFINSTLKQQASRLRSALLSPQLRSSLDQKVGETSPRCQPQVLGHEAERVIKMISKLLRGEIQNTCFLRGVAHSKTRQTGRE